MAVDVDTNSHLHSPRLYHHSLRSRVNGPIFRCPLR